MDKKSEPPEASLWCKCTTTTGKEFAMNLRALADQAGTVILEVADGGAVLYRSPSRLLVAWCADEVRPVLVEAERLASEGLHLAGYLAYEAAGAFDLAVHDQPSDLPLVWLGVYDCVESVVRDAWADLSSVEVSPMPEGCFNVSEQDYISAVERVREWIAAGDTYQVNLTCKARFRLPGGDDIFARYCQLREAHPVPYGAFLNLGKQQVLSLSPELFLHRTGNRLLTRPMKGTMHRGAGWRDDERLRRELHQSEKNRAENVMIVDLMRNDLGRVCQIGSVRVPRLFETERYGSVHQMTSTVTGRTDEGCGLVEILEATFPCGSITGAPKRRTMEIIRELEPEARGVYCGAIGRITPGGDFQFNVAIRTLVHHGNGECEMGVGSGITWGSDPKSEWEETYLKSCFLQARPRDFSLIETMLLLPGGGDARPVYPLVCRHIARLLRSARYWDFPFPKDAIREELRRCASQPIPPEGVAVRLAVNRFGQLDTRVRPVGKRPNIVRLQLRDERLDSTNNLLRHKTDARELYDRAWAEATKAGCLDALFLNERGTLCEGAITNIFLKLDDEWFTPPLDDGLLPGVWRAIFMKETTATECPLSLDDLAAAAAICIGNSVRGRLDVDEICNPSGAVLWRAD